MPSLDAFKSGCLFVVVEKQGLELLHIGRGVGTAIQDTPDKTEHQREVFNCRVTGIDRAMPHSNLFEVSKGGDA